MTHEAKQIAVEENRQKDLERWISTTLEENYRLRFVNDESIKTIQKVREKISQRYEMYEKELEDLYEYKQSVKERVDLEVKSDIDFNSKVKSLHTALKPKKALNFTNKLTNNEHQIDWLKQIVDNEKNRANQRLEMVREKTKMLKQLISSEDSEIGVAEILNLRRNNANVSIPK